MSKFFNRILVQPPLNEYLDERLGKLSLTILNIEKVSLRIMGHASTCQLKELKRMRRCARAPKRSVDTTQEVKYEDT